MHVNIRHFAAISAVARERSVQRAAECVHLAQPTISQAILKIEQTLAVQLFHRTGSGMLPTNACLEFAERIDRGMAFLARADAAIAGRRLPDQSASHDAPISNRATYSQLQALMAVVKFSSYTAAAASIGVKIPTLHKAVKELEETAQVELLKRRGRSVEPTELARTISQHAGVALAEFSYAHEELSELSGDRINQLAIGSLPLGRSFLIPRAIDVMLAREPSVRISLDNASYVEQLAALRNGDLDMIFGALRYPCPSNDVLQEALFTDSLSILARTGHPALCRAELDLEFLAGFPWIVPPKSIPTRVHFENFFLGKIGRVPSSIIECSSPVAVREMLLGADRLSFMSKRQLSREIAEGRLMAVVEDIAGTEREIGLTTRKDWKPTRVRAAFIDILREVARENYQVINQVVPVDTA
ncbi:MAG: LysR family transcriptional regulator [Hyphomonas sp.]|uniref:LysR family transcriptional regulator n=1 Tax=Hyphomonas sp. TaxID=87 RepID=UPI00184050FC|nr:LysR family transcriptional regulator [Hyphomonas sp.]MBA3069706.1 LysR family transcriptional regulator [Hyphomonas sp.]MBU3918977.1 LysR family transcriptional regulator [Alphaproteobacteria bacterium]MBU4062547.1 LysR family transcriptional regulator [Alphaproteobacteria bacterium]